MGPCLYRAFSDKYCKICICDLGFRGCLVLRTFWVKCSGKALFVVSVGHKQIYLLFWIQFFLSNGYIISFIFVLKLSSALGRYIYGVTGTNRDTVTMWLKVFNLFLQLPNMLIRHHLIKLYFICKNDR